MVLRGICPLHQEVMVEALREARLHRFYRMLPELFCLACRGVFVDRQYSPSTDMDRSEWEIIL
jgi:hypothetical protein